MRTIIRFLLISLSGIWLWTLCPPGAFAEDKQKAKSDCSVREKDFARFVEIKGAKRVGSDQCQRCHLEEFKIFRRTRHSQEAVECESCHGPGSRHPGSPSVSLDVKVCASCHQDGTHHVLDQVRAVDKTRLAKRLGVVSAKTLTSTLRTLQEVFAE